MNSKAGSSKLQWFKVEDILSSVTLQLYGFGIIDWTSIESSWHIIVLTMRTKFTKVNLQKQQLAMNKAVVINSLIVITTTSQCELNVSLSFLLFVCIQKKQFKFFTLYTENCKWSYFKYITLEEVEFFYHLPITMNFIIVYHNNVGLFCDKEEKRSTGSNH